LTLGALSRSQAPGLARLHRLPRGYGLSLLGVVIFATGGLADAVWHVLFGIEADVEALLSPTHLLLGLGAVLMVTGPLRSSWQQSDPAPRWSARLPGVLSLALFLSLLTFFTQYAHPIARPWAASGNQPTTRWFSVQLPDPLFAASGIGSGFVAQALGVTSVLLQAGLMMGVILVSARRWQWSLPHGSLTIIFTVNASLLGFMRDEKILLPAATLAGIVGDLLFQRLRPSPARPLALRVFAFGVPTTFYLLHFLTLRVTKGVWWSVHLWSGTIVLAGTVGWLLSYMVMMQDSSRSEPDDRSSSAEAAVKQIG
jgi:hypothetical protein